MGSSGRSHLNHTNSRKSRWTPHGLVGLGGLGARFYDFPLCPLAQWSTFHHPKYKAQLPARNFDAVVICVCTVASLMTLFANE
jgi:hypothetical protein